MAGNDDAVRGEIDNQISREANDMATAQDEEKREQARRRARELMRRRAAHTSDEEIARYRRESMNFTEYLEAQCDPLYEVKGALPKCPPGYRYSREEKQCVPKTDKDDVRLNKGGSKDSSPTNGPGYNVWGRTGVNGDGYAYAEPNNWDTAAYEGPSGGNYN